MIYENQKMCRHCKSIIPVDCFDENTYTCPDCEQTFDIKFNAINAKGWVIKSDEGYWNNHFGWVEEGATVFTERERNEYMLPIGKHVKWIKI